MAQARFPVADGTRSVPFGVVGVEPRVALESVRVLIDDRPYHIAFTRTDETTDMPRGAIRVPQARGPGSFWLVPEAG